jgi:N-acetylglucosamine-6-phosphate deacetylase
MEIHVSKLFDGDEWHENVVLLTSRDSGEQKVISIRTEGFDKQKAVPMVIPALIDIQIYGAFGRLLSEYPTVDTVQKIARYSLEGGARYFQPTIASQSKEIIYQAIDCVRKYIDEGRQGCIGLHLEGPWINTNKRGAHDQNIVHSPTLEEVKEILDYGKNVISMITIAPERCDETILQYINDQNIIISIGHSDATYQEALQSFPFIPVATHLFNAMSAFQHRSPGLVGAVLNHDSIMSSIVVDGYHVDWAAIQIAKKIMKDRLFCITDAVTETNTGAYQHQLVEEGDRYESHGILSGSALTQLKSIRNLVDQVGLELGEAIRMCSVYPARILNNKTKKRKNDNQTITGRIVAGESTEFICVDGNLNLLKVE